MIVELPDLMDLFLRTLNAMLLKFCDHPFLSAFYRIFPDQFY